ncbi:hypothetical protein ABLN72_13850, partial [Mycobacterium tuberculosis]
SCTSFGAPPRLRCCLQASQHFHCFRVPRRRKPFRVFVRRYLPSLRVAATVGQLNYPTPH